MIVGIPKGLLYYKYFPFFESFFNELGAEIIVSPDTNKNILNSGVKYCVDEACLPVKIFHGHVSYLRDKSDIIFIPRVMQLKEREFICPKFCGLPEMIKNSIPNLPYIISYPIYAYSKNKFMKFIFNTGHLITKNNFKIKKAYEAGINAQKNYHCGINDNEYTIKVSLAGHPYNIYDKFSNMDIIKKLNSMSIGAITEENVEESLINNETSKLFKRPFWTFARQSYGSSVFLANNQLTQGIIYISSFACGIDSVVIDLIKDQLPDFPILVLKIDEHTGEAGLNTRLEAFSDMLERRLVVWLLHFPI